MADGLAIYVYAYPGFPTRANAYGHLQAGESEAERLSRLNQLDVDATARSWVRLLVRALHLGFLPYTYQNEGLGACFDAGNACVDGGMVDMDSLVPIDDARDDGELYDALVVLRRGVERTLSTLLPHACQFETKGVFVQEYVCELFRCAFDEEQRPGTRLDPRVRDVFQPLSYADLVVRLQSRRRVSEPFFK
ncbi:MAG: hypothetical protein IPO67_28460 [Deltaproteobacteria bacterium]|nr:hypothetical protein [Deltaproteobacteria bacterium]